MNIFKMRAADPGPGPAARILKMFISRSGFEGGDPLLNDVQWICVYLGGLARICVDLHGFTWIYVDLCGFPGFQGSGVFRTVAAFGGLLPAVGNNQLPLKEGLWSFGGLDPGCLEAWRLGGLEAWRLRAWLPWLRLEAWRLQAPRLARCSDTLDARRGRRIWPRPV